MAYQRFSISWGSNDLASSMINYATVMRVVDGESEAGRENEDSGSVEDECSGRSNGEQIQIGSDYRQILLSRKRSRKA